MELTDWDCQAEIEKLVASGFAEMDYAATGWWLKYAEDHNNAIGAHPMYRWTASGKKACFRWANSTPMAWASSMHEGKERHCAACGRDLYRKNTGEQIIKGTKAIKNRCICLTCHRRGITLRQLIGEE